MFKLARLIVISTLLLALSPTSERATAEKSAGIDQQASLELSGRPALFRPIEVRTRRLHMVRPDLLRYPIQYDTFC